MRLGNRLSRVIIAVLLFSGSCQVGSETDHTLSAEEYRNHGMPVVSEPWDQVDYTRGCNILEEIKISNELSLPMKESSRSGKYFEHIVNPGHITFAMNDTIPLHERANQLFPYINIQRHLIYIYTDRKQTEQYYHRELIEIYLFGIQIVENLLDLGNQINESDDEMSIEMHSGYFSIIEVYHSMILFILENQQRSSIFQEDDLISLSHTLYHSLDSYVDCLGPSSREEIKKELQLVLEENDTEEIESIYSDLIDKL